MRWPEGFATWLRAWRAVPARKPTLRSAPADSPAAVCRPTLGRALCGGLALGAALLAACSTPAPSPSAPAQSAPAVAVPMPELRPEPPLLLVDDLQRLRGMPGPDLYAETQKLLASSEPRARLKAAIALAQPQHPARDEARAVALAEDVARAGDTPPALRDLAAVVALWLDEMRRAEASGRRAQTKAREDEARVALIEARLRDMEKRAQEAEKKLEALRAIERDLSGRGAANGRP
jgi:hypothetical protein